MAGTRKAGSAGQRTLKILQAIVDANGAATVPDIMESVELPKPTVHRLVGLLEEEGFVVREPDGRSYVPGPVLHRLSYGVLRSRAYQAARHVVLENVAHDLHEACNLVILDGDQITYIDRIDSSWPLSIRFTAGSHVPLHCTATGKLLLGMQHERLRERLLSALRLPAQTQRTITDLSALREELDRAREQQVGTDNQEFIEGMVAVAVPVIADPSQPPVAALSVHAPIFRISLEQLWEHVPKLRSAARQIAELMDE